MSLALAGEKNLIGSCPSHMSQRRLTNAGPLACVHVCSLLSTRPSYVSDIAHAVTHNPPCVCYQTPEGDSDLLLTAMDAMNSDPDPEAEDRKGCSGHVGKMIFSAGSKQLAIVAYVPDGEHNKSAGNVDVQLWTETVCAAVAGKIVKPAAPAKSPKGGKVVVAVVASDPDKGKFAIKDKDAAMAAAFGFLREKVR